MQYFIDLDEYITQKIKTHHHLNWQVNFRPLPGECLQKTNDINWHLRCGINCVHFFPKLHQVSSFFSYFNTTYPDYIRSKVELLNNINFDKTLKAQQVISPKEQFSTISHIFESMISANSFFDESGALSQIQGCSILIKKYLPTIDALGYESCLSLINSRSINNKAYDPTETIAWKICKSKTLSGLRVNSPIYNARVEFLKIFLSSKNIKKALLSFSKEGYSFCDLVMLAENSCTLHALNESFGFGNILSNLTIKDKSLQAIEKRYLYPNSTQALNSDFNSLFEQFFTKNEIEKLHSTTPVLTLDASEALKKENKKFKI